MIKLIFSVAVVISQIPLFAYSASDKDLCSTQFLKISRDGSKTNVTKKGREQFSFEKSKNRITFKPHFFSKQGMKFQFLGQVLESAEFKENKIDKVVYSDMGYMGFGFRTEYRFGYKNGRCFVKQKFENGFFQSDTELCNELKAVLDQSEQCNSTCNSRLTQIFNKYKVNTHGNKAASAGEFIGACKSDKYLRTSFEDKTLWQSSQKTQPAKQSSAVK